jgi:hypothetical protein
MGRGGDFSLTARQKPGKDQSLMKKSAAGVYKITLGKSVARKPVHTRENVNSPLFS